jgi:DNA-binding NarL/FixJ family response regulator
MEEINHNSISGCVVLADSHPTMLEGTRGLLETAFSEVVMVADRESMFKAIEHMKPEMLVADLSLLMLEGECIICELKRRFPGLKCIVLSLRDESVFQDRAMDEGAAGFVSKYSIATDLLHAVDEVRLGHTFVSSSA